MCVSVYKRIFTIGTRNNSIRSVLGNALTMDNTPSEATTEESPLNQTNESIHPFNTSLKANETVIEAGSDSGVEVIEQPIPPKSPTSDNLLIRSSCESSIISCCSNYEEAYDLLVRRNSTLIDGTTTSDNGSESSSVGATTRTNSARQVTKRQSTASANSNKKRVSVADSQARKVAPKERSRSKPPPFTATVRLKSIDRLQNAKKSTAPTSLDLKIKKSAPAASGKNALTPTDDGRWPSIHSKPAPLLSRSTRNFVDTPKSNKIMTSSVTSAENLLISNSKTIEKYATLPRRRKTSPSKTREESLNRLLQPLKRKDSAVTATTPRSVGSKKQKQKIKIYHEISCQTALTLEDVGKALAGVAVVAAQPKDVEKCDRAEQIDFDAREFGMLQTEIEALKTTIVSLEKRNFKQSEKVGELETRLKEEILEKDGLKEELRMNSQRVLSILGGGEDEETTGVSSDSLMELESRFHNARQVVSRQMEENSMLNSQCRQLQMQLDKCLATQSVLIQQHKELEAESAELQEFIQAEKTTLSDALKEAENEMNKLQDALKEKQKQLEESNEECKKLNRENEQRWQENLGLQAKMGALEAKSREMLVRQGSGVSGTAVALSALINRLEGLVDELVASYSISDQELEDVIYHNEVYSNSSSSPDATPEKSARAKFHLLADKTPSPKKGSNFMSAVINAIRNAAGASSSSAYQDDFRINGNLCADELSSSNEMLDSETEPCLMMEHVLEDVVIPDGHTHNMISSHHSILSSQSDSFLETRTNNKNEIMSEMLPSFSLVDQVIDVDNLVTRLLKVIRIIQIENEDCMNELQEQRDSLSDQVAKQKETNRMVGKQLKDWEVLGARLKTEVKELMQQLCRKTNEIDNIKTELNKQREQVEKLNQDVCELSTALAKAELEMKMKEEEVGEAVKMWEQGNEELSSEVLGRLMVSHNEVTALRERLAEKERRLSELSEEFLASKQVLTESLKVAVGEAKKQYEAIDNALEVLHNNQNVVQQCAALAELQRELENTSFQCALAMPLGAVPADCNANAAMMQARANMQINTTA